MAYWSSSSSDIQGTINHPILRLQVEGVDADEAVYLAFLNSKYKIIIQWLYLNSQDEKVQCEYKSRH